MFKMKVFYRVKEPSLIAPCGFHGERDLYPWLRNRGRVRGRVRGEVWTGVGLGHVTGES